MNPPEGVIHPAAGSALTGLTRTRFDRGERAYELWQSRSAQAQQLFGEIPGDIDELKARAAGHTVSSQKRRDMLIALTPFWNQLPLPEASQRSIEKLADPATHIIIAGQQPALSGGPLFLLAKLATVIELARRLEDAGQPAVPLFWIADEDHDVGELYSGDFFTTQGPSGPLSEAPPVPFPQGRRSIGKLRLPESHKQEFGQRLQEALGAAPIGLREALELFEATWHSSPSRAFQQLLLALLPESGVLLVSPEPLRALAAPMIRREILHRGKLAEEVRAQIPALQSQGIPVPIPEPPELPFFWIDDEGARHRLQVEESSGADSSVGFRSQDSGKRFFTEAELTRDLQRAPERFSPDALLRPLIQDSIFEPLITVAGPTEMAYQLELGTAYAPRDIPRPVLWPRFRWRMLETHTSRKFELLGIDPSEFEWGFEEGVADRSESAAAELERNGNELLDHVSRLAREAPHMAKKLDRVERRWRKDLAKLGDSVRRDFDLEQGRRRQQLIALQEALWPGGTPLERRVSLLSFVARYGIAAIRKLGSHDDSNGDPNAIDPFDARPILRLIDPQKGESSDGSAHDSNR